VQRSLKLNEGVQIAEFPHNMRTFQRAIKVPNKPFNNMHYEKDFVFYSLFKTFSLFVRLETM
jgi:hypothetical protein